MSGIGDTPEDWLREETAKEPPQEPDRRRRPGWLAVALLAVAIALAGALMGVLRDDVEAQPNGSPWRGERIAGIGALV